MDLLTGIRRDIALAVRSLTKARAFTFVCVVSLGIGMTPVIAVPYGARMFSSPPPGLNTDPLVELVTTPEGSRRATDQWSYPDFVALREANTGVTFVGWETGDVELGLAPAQGGKTTARTLFVSANYFPVLDVPLVQGAGLRDTTDPIVVVSYAFWQRRLDADPSVVGTVIPVNNVSHTVIGVAPEHFGGHLAFHQADLFMLLERHPMVLADTTIRFDRSREWVNIHGRLSTGVSVAQASAAVGAFTAQLAKEHPSTNEFKLGVVEPYHPIGVLGASEMRVFRAVLQTLTVLPLLVVCLNIAGMVQVRGAMRERELSIRQAIGASRARLMRQMLAESLVLAGLGATLASLLLFYLVPLGSLFDGAPPAMAAALRVDAGMIAICAGLCLITSLVFGWLPAARFSRPRIITVLKDDAGGGRARVGRVQRVAVALQIAIATPLLVLAGMTLDRVRATATSDLGFDAEHLYAAPLNLDAVDGGNAWTRVQGIRDELARTSGVTSVTLADGLPLDFRYRMTRVATQPGDDTAPKVVSAHVTRVGDGYFDTMGIALVRGRTFIAEDGVGAEHVAIVSKPLAEQLFPGADPLGQRLTFDMGERQGQRQTFDSGSKTGRTIRIVGVSSDFPTSQMSTSRAQVLLPLAQYPDVVADSVRVDDDRGGTARLMLVARSAPGESAITLTAALENVIRELDSEFESSSIVTGAWLRQNSVRDFMTQSAVAGTVGGILLLLAALGIYGVVGLMVATRIREIAVRVALGASRGRVLRLVLFDVVKLIAPGVAVGLLLAVAFVKLNGEDFGIALSGLEPLAYIVGASIAVLIALAAALAPARRAASVQPMVAMRSE